MERPFTVVGSEVDGQREIVLSTRSDLIAELKLREEQVLSLAQTAARWEDADQSLEQAMNLLGYKKGNESEVIVAKVLVRTRNFSNEELLLDLGIADGIELNDPVVSGDGLFVGTIEEVFEHTSRVALLTNTNSVVGASILDGEDTTGIVSGGHGSLVRMGFVPVGTVVNVNDVIVTSGIDPNVPRGLTIGLVNTIEEDDNAPFLHLFIEPLADIDHLRVLGVVKIEQL
jgi:rod shape-determining protein MreC